jgi:hypothetical protein
MYFLMNGITPSESITPPKRSYVQTGGFKGKIEIALGP